MGLAATLQASAVIPNFVITEYFVNFQELGDAISSPPFRLEEGCIRLPSSPGLGIEIDEAALKNYAMKEFPLRKW